MFLKVFSLLNNNPGTFVESGYFFLLPISQFGLSGLLIMAKKKNVQTAFKKKITCIYHDKEAFPNANIRNQHN